MIPLPRDQHWKAANALEDVPFNTLFASTVADNVLPGRVFVDCVKEPTVFLVAHPYGMSLLFGRTDAAEFNAALHGYLVNAKGDRKGAEWLQVHPIEWKQVLEHLLGSDLAVKQSQPEIPAASPNDPGKVMEYTRVNFRFDRARYTEFSSRCPPTPGTIVRTDSRMFREMQGQVIPKNFWMDEDHFMGEGVGFTLMAEGRPAATAFCAFLKDNMLEIGIETDAMHRGKGYAAHACKALIDYCIENGFEPIWSCRLENAGSFRLALKLGFEPTLYIPYYQLVSKA
jgi:RimJ/RimL family protein N-acetyltransferase